jgi:peptide/nickel transport system permease protein
MTILQDAPLVSPGSPQDEAAVPAGGTSTAGSRRVRALPVDVVVFGVFTAALAVAAAAPSLLQTHDPFSVDPVNAFHSPDLTHLFGTDQSGRDVFSRVVEGTQQSILIGIGSTAIGLLLGAMLGVTAGLVGRGLDNLITRIVEVLYSFPALLLALIFIGIAGPGTFTLTLAVGIGTAPGYARIVRAQTLKVASSSYVETSVLLGRSRRHTLWHTIIPNVARPLVSLATLGIGQAIVWATALSFLGLGAQPPAAEWGTMLSDGRAYIQLAWWIALFPGLAITLTALAATVVGRYLQGRIEGATR